MPSIAQPTIETVLPAPYPPVSFRAEPEAELQKSKIATLLLQDGTSHQGYSFGAEGKSVAGELVFQTGKFSTC
jgi:hypothetical protein